MILAYTIPTVGTPGGQVSWNIFDGMLTRGKVVQAKALYDKSRTDVVDTGRAD